MTKVLLAMAFMAAPFVQAQSLNQVWFVMWGGQPTPGGDNSLQNITANGTGSAINAGTAASIVSQTNFSSFNSPYDIAVDPAMGKAYVLDNNQLSGTGVPEYVYSFNLTGTPAQIAASAQVIYTMPTTAGDTNANYYGYLGGIALDPTNHYLYFDQMDISTPTNSYIGRLDLTNSSASDIYSPNNNSPALHIYYAGQIPGFGPIALDATNLYLGAWNTRNGADGVYTAPISGSGSFSEAVAVSMNDTTFPNGFISGVASDPQLHLIYYLTTELHSPGINTNYSVTQNAFWQYNTVTHVKMLIASGYQGLPDNIALDVPNNRYYFTAGRDDTGNVTPTDNQAIYTGVLGSTSAPTLFYTPILTGQDPNGNLNAGGVAVQGIYVVDTGSNPQAPVAVPQYVTAEANQTLELPITNLLANDSDPNSYPLNINGVSNTSNSGGSVVSNGVYIAYTPPTNYTGSDQFTYTLADSHSLQSVGTVYVNVVALNPPASNHISMAIVPTGRFLLFSGASNQFGIVQYANTLNGPWNYLSQTIPAGASGVIEYNDLTAPAPSARFYQIVIVP
jgi:hypothetical protein